MHIQARRVFRLALIPSLTLVVAYALSVPLPFIAPLFAFILGSIPGPPLPAPKLISLIIMVILTTGIGIVLIPLLLNYPVTAVLLVAIGLYLSTYLTVNLNKDLPGMFMAMGLTLVSAAGTLSDALAVIVIQSLIFGIIIATLCQALVYPFFPEDPLPPQATPPKEQTKNAEQSNWIAIRSTLIVLPAYLLVLINPAMYMPIMMKSIMLSQQSSTMDAKHAAREMIGSTFLGGVFAILLWLGLGIWPTLWMFFWWMLLISLYFSSKIYQLVKTRLSASFWMNTAITMLILIGPAVEDTDSGKDVYTAFFIRLSLFVLVTLYALAAINILEYLKTHKRKSSYAD